MDEDRRPAVGYRERVAPEPERETEPDVGREQRVRPLAREVRGCCRDAEANRVERFAECTCAFLGPAEERLGVGDRRRPCVRG